MEWVYPCGGMPMSTNRTKWPYMGGAVAFQPGWFPGHKVGFIYVNIGVTLPGEMAPRNMSFNVVPPFQIVGPSNEMYDGTICLPQVPMPANVHLKPGDNITIQVVETAQHGAALYNCVDVTLAEPEEVVRVDQSNCFNSSSIGIQYLFTTTNLNGSGASLLQRPSFATALMSTLLAATLYAFW
ncbi:hypothetical protein KVT40_009139 [Elsinoe batatas]|uniref:Copper acquisition factor BIM1-like domain-containing protein n=1 Tax=Elsinoe batatas TaxID=2601811 RepID=A0A8K0PEF8_9PEZI|nr:hypothetical protein KVT40_009139 [Elsinoe batatas]